MGAAEREVASALGRAGLAACARPLVVMLSGGRDSVCLLDALVLCNRRAPLHALHVNYGLRGIDCEEDERLCVELCGQRGVPIKVVHASAPPARGNLQAWARELRYREALALATALGSDARVLTAHTLSDQAETILYRLAASPGRRALLGMRASEGALVRPLLSLSREQTTAYCRQRGLRWREDASNESERFARSRARQALLPAFRSLHPAAERNLARSAALLRAEAEVLERLVADQLGGGEAIELARLRSLPGALARLVLIELAERATGRFVPQAGERLEELIALDSERRSGAPARRQLHVGGGAAALIEGGVLRMVALERRGRSAQVDCALALGGTEDEQGSG